MRTTARAPTSTRPAARRGCGGSGIWRDGQPARPRNFRKSRVLASGPIRLVFELDYEPSTRAAPRWARRKRVMVDAGRNLHRFESLYRSYRRPGQGEPEITWAAGIKKHPDVRRALREGAGHRAEPGSRSDEEREHGLRVVVDPARIVENAEADGNHLASNMLNEGRT